MSKNKADELEAMVAVAVHGLQEKKGLKIVSIDLRDIGNAFSDYFVICSGSSSRQVDALADSVEDELRNSLGEKPKHREGGENAEWVLLDYYNVVIHIFSEEKRDFYGLEELWGDGKIKTYEE
jgi:ribosome-associated protein